jgi:hypothetical protein
MWCPNGAYPNLLKVKNISWCWTRLNHSVNFSNFGGFRFNAYFADDVSNRSNPPEITVQDEGRTDLQRCEVQDIPAAQEDWLGMPNSPFWTATGWWRIHDDPDRQFDFRLGGFPHEGPRIRYFHPSDDPNVSGWYS